VSAAGVIAARPAENTSTVRPDGREGQSNADLLDPPKLSPPEEPSPFTVDDRANAIARTQSAEHPWPPEPERPMPASPNDDAPLKDKAHSRNSSYFRPRYEPTAAGGMRITDSGTDRGWRGEDPISGHSQLSKRPGHAVVAYADASATFGDDCHVCRWICHQISFPGCNQSPSMKRVELPTVVAEWSGAVAVVDHGAVAVGSPIPPGGVRHPRSPGAGRSRAVQSARQASAVVSATGTGGR
jgi:hypothetical protein